MISSILANISKKAVPLGRWSLKRCKDLEDRHVFYTNRDHCGDHICGKPVTFDHKLSKPATVIAPIATRPFKSSTSGVHTK